MEEKFEPKIAAFVCNWCTYTGADLAGTSRLKQEANARLIRVPCTGRIDPVFIIKAFENGADGVLISGCHPGDCHYNAGNFHARRRWILFKNLLDFIGIDSSRLYFSWVSASEGKKWVDIVDGVIDAVRIKGPFKQYKKMNKEIEIPVAVEEGVSVK
ncbi:MAG: hydrogenase iron-sulfur subunit [Ignavibacteriaceae bacterium]|jgi:coenzyme F420-reducing hydrogenase delta subunit|nr:hydrogenase iron-sulfur subunit [Ignavibacteriaceae bacterium]